MIFPYLHGLWMLASIMQNILLLTLWYLNRLPRVKEEDIEAQSQYQEKIEYRLIKRALEKQREQWRKDEEQLQLHMRRREERLLDDMFTCVHECYCVPGRYHYRENESKIWLSTLIRDFNIQQMNHPIPKDASQLELWMRATYNRVREGFDRDFDDSTKQWILNMVEDYNTKKKVLEFDIDKTAENGTWIMIEKEW